MYYLISDTHFHHTNIIKYCNRPFESVEVMNFKLIQNWNSVVKKDDIVFFVGDFTIKSSPHFAQQILDKLNGRICLIYGNHDSAAVKKLDRWERVVPYATFKYKGLTIEMQHHPWSYNEYAKYSKNILIHGHTHGTMGLLNCNMIDVSCENLNYTPASLDELIETKLFYDTTESSFPDAEERYQAFRRSIGS